MLSDFFFDTPWWLLFALFVVGSSVFVSGNRRQKRPIEQAGIAVLLLAVIMLAVSYFVETGKEYCVRRTRQLVRAADQKDWAAFKANLDAKTQFLMFGGPDAITEAAKIAAERAQLGKVVITGTDVTQNPSQIDVAIRVFSEQLGTAGATDWRLTFLRDGDKWVLYRVEPIRGANFNPERIAREMQRGR